jgi:hypothetical protein
MILDFCIGMIMKRQRETQQERALAQLIRRKMIQRDHGSQKEYKRVNKRVWDDED